MKKFATDETLCLEALKRAGSIASELQCSASNVLLVAFSTGLLSMLKETAVRLNKAVEVIEHRGDLEQVQKAVKHARFVVALPEYVGGLEFHAVILLGVDEGRVPPTSVSAGNQSRHFLLFRSHNHLYVAITRARYRVEVFVNEARGVSKILTSAVAAGLLAEEGLEGK